MRDTCTSIADKVILGKEKISKSVKCFQKNTNVLCLSPFFSVKKKRKRCTVLRNAKDIIKMIEARAGYILPTAYPAANVHFFTLVKPEETQLSLKRTSAKYTQQHSWVSCGPTFQLHWPQYF